MIEEQTNVYRLLKLFYFNLLNQYIHVLILLAVLFAVMGSTITV